MAEVTCARIHPSVAFVTPRSRYLKKSRRPLTNSGAFALDTASFVAGCASAGFSLSAVSPIVMLKPPPDGGAAIIAASLAEQRGPPSPRRKIGVNLTVPFKGGSHGEYPGCSDRSQPRAQRKYRAEERQ